MRHRIAIALTALFCAHPALAGDAGLGAVRLPADLQWKVEAESFTAVDCLRVTRSDWARNQLSPSQRRAARAACTNTPAAGRPAVEDLPAAKIAEAAAPR